MDNEALLQQARAILQNKALTDALAELLAGQRGGLGFLLRTLKSRPQTFNAYVLKGMSVLGQPASLDVKTAELVAVGAAAALMCEHCLEAHISRAVSAGATFDEVTDAALIAGAIAESSTLSVALRKLKQLEAKHNRRRPPASGGGNTP
ncbi:MAG: carboxymuconolactone decarboxylase family protein [Anaerolineae bacterium]